MKKTKLAIITASLFLFLPSSAFAHHVVDGKIPSNFKEGILSGLAHPVIGTDHLLFILILSIFSLLLSKTAGIYGFVGGTVAGTVFHLMSLNIPNYETIVAVSLLAMGAFTLFSKLHKTAPVAVFFTVAGIFHGYAYGESIIGANPMPLVSYMTGFAVVQLAVCFGLYFLLKKLFGAPKEETTSRNLKFTLCALSAGASLFLLLS